VENPKWEKTRVGMSKKSIMVMEKYIIDLKAMCSKKRLTSDYKFT